MMSIFIYSWNMVTFYNSLTDTILKWNINYDFMFFHFYSVDVWGYWLYFIRLRVFNKICKGAYEILWNMVENIIEYIYHKVQRVFYITMFIMTFLTIFLDYNHIMLYVHFF